MLTLDKINKALEVTWLTLEKIDRKVDIIADKIILPVPVLYKLRVAVSKYDMPLLRFDSKEYCYPITDYKDVTFMPVMVKWGVIHNVGFNYNKLMNIQLYDAKKLHFAYSIEDYKEFPSIYDPYSFKSALTVLVNVLNALANFNMYYVRIRPNFVDLTPYKDVAAQVLQNLIE
jgi:hypothetical protein